MRARENDSKLDGSISENLSSSIYTIKDAGKTTLFHYTAGATPLTDQLYAKDLGKTTLFHYTAGETPLTNLLYPKGTSKNLAMALKKQQLTEDSIMETAKETGLTSSEPSVKNSPGSSKKS